jgi:hypothetical protein
MNTLPPCVFALASLVVDHVGSPIAPASALKRGVKKPFTNAPKMAVMIDPTELIKTALN